MNWILIYIIDHNLSNICRIICGSLSPNTDHYVADERLQISYERS